MDVLNDDPLMIARGQLSTLRREWNQQRKTATEIAGRISNLALDANRRLNDNDPEGAISSLESIGGDAKALRSLCDSIDALQAQMKPLQAVAWPTGRIDE
jgi:hypothetical protein